ncbi:MAG TPA: nucleoside triphosphate pyrophosphohydrolase [Victivallales bacterium]|nr:nucleoside triphosphate pyrophosphohydrolase [Victivallales bacterium]HRR05654.1 nucleoside triphosphate pyrophosphohydrolase [Victivallales bacterium]HRR28501.1 nucleoside triphosphate pyrophosphohydrolase [Victivallales bacterium]HRU00182.1 nucleoside triphosphate pyrophosphohydrolase [Victivallales bacterium]
MTAKKRNPSLSSELVHDLLNIMKKLRSKKGCPWDREQTHQSLKKYLIEECAEFLDAVDDNDDNGMKEEVGDVLLHVIFHCQIASERGAFDFHDVVHSLCNKLRRRHPHVFGDSRANSSKDVLKIWNDVKKTEGKNDNSSGVSGLRHFPALFRAEEIQKRASKVGFDWENENQILEKIKEELSELENALKTKSKPKIEDELGDLLFSIVNLARFLKGKSSEEILAKTTAKFQNRFKFIEEELRKKNKIPHKTNLNEMEKLWQKAKKREKKIG